MTDYDYDEHWRALRTLYLQSAPEESTYDYVLRAARTCALIGEEQVGLVFDDWDMTEMIDGFLKSWNSELVTGDERFVVTWLVENSLSRDSTG